MAAMKGRSFAFVQHIPSETPRTILLHQFLPTVPPPLDATDQRLIERVRRCGRLECGSVFDEIETSGSSYFPSIRAAEQYSRKANRKNSVWFNDEMLRYWRAKWKEQDELWAEIKRETDAEQKARRRKQLEWKMEEARAMAEHRKWEKQKQKEEAKALRSRWWFAWQRMVETRGKPPLPNPECIIYWDTHVVVRIKDYPLLSDALKQELEVRAVGRRVMVLWPSLKGLRMIWPEYCRYER